MTPAREKLVATIFILLLAGSEGARIRAHQKQNDLDFEPTDDDAPMAKQLQKANEDQCSYSLRKLSCQGEGCRFRPLPFDRGMSKRCRLSDTYMLSSPELAEKFAIMQADLLSEKAQVYSQKCTTNTTWRKSFARTPFCVRRGAQMMQASGFLAKVQQDAESAADVKDEVREKVDAAMSELASVLGEDGEYIIKFKEKMSSNAGAFVKHPISAARATARTLAALVGNDNAAKQEAKLKVDGMASGVDDDLSESDVQEIEEQLQAANQAYTADDVKASWRNVEKELPWSSTSEEGSDDVNDTALLELDDEDSNGGARLLMFIFIATILCTILLVVLIDVLSITGLVAPLMVAGVLIAGFSSILYYAGKGEQRAFSKGEMNVSDAPDAPKDDGDFWTAFGMKDGEAYPTPEPAPTHSPTRGRADKKRRGGDRERSGKNRRK